MDRRFDRLTQVDSGWFRSIFLVLFLIDFFSIPSFNIRFIEIELHNLYWFSFYEVIIVSWPDIWIVKLTWIDQICCRLSIYKKIYILNICFKSNYVLTSHPGCFWTRQVNQITSNQSPYHLKKFIVEKTLATPKHFYFKIN
jgi:hypothetical protein